MNEYPDHKPEECTITFAGDMLCPAELTECTGGNYEICFEKIAPYLKKADLAVANLETPVAGEDLRYTYEKYRFNTPESYLTAIKSAGISFVSCAMNHCMDRDEIGIDRTLDNCRAAGIETTGIYKTAADRDKISVKIIGGIKVAFVNYTYGTNAFAHRTFLRNGYKVNLLQPEETLEGSIHLLNSPEQIEADVKRIYSDEKEKYAPIVDPYLNRLERDLKEAKKQADFVVMLLHCGGQYNAEVDAYTRFVVGKIKEYGADAIVGLHPHIIQKSEYADGIFTAFCLGNFLATRIDDSGEIDWRYNAVLNMRLSKRADGSIGQKYSFALCYTDDSLGYPVIRNTAEMYAENPTADLKEKILFYASRFAGGVNYNEVKPEYELPFVK